MFEHYLYQMVCFPYILSLDDREKGLVMDITYSLFMEIY